MESPMLLLDEKLGLTYNVHETGLRLFKDERLYKEVPVEEMIGCIVFQSEGARSKLKLEVYYFEKKMVEYNKFGPNKIESRKIKTLNLFNNNIDTLKSLKKRIMEQMYKSQKEVYTRRYNEEDRLYYYKKALVFVNPNSGKGKGLEIYDKYSKFLKANGILLEKVETKPDKFVENLVKEMPKAKLIEFDLVICISGDGTPHEILNGYMKRIDIDFDKERITLAQLPAGSGCALLENCMKYSNKEWSLENALHAICHMNRKAFNTSVYSYLTNDKRKGEIWSFLSLSYGYIADVDIYSEKLRWLGRARFDVYGAFKMLKLNTYRTVIYTQKEGEISLPDIETPINEESFNVNKENLYMFLSMDLPFISSDYRAAPSLKDFPVDTCNLQTYEKQKGRWNFVKLMLNHEAINPEIKDYGLKFTNVKEFRLILEDNEKKKNIVIDGETYKSEKIKAIQMNKTDRSYYTLV